MYSKSEAFHQFKTLIQQEFGEVMRSRLPFFASGFYLIFFFLFFAVALNESSVLGFTGMSRVLFSLSHGFLFFLPLLALSSTAESISQSRANGTLEFMFSHPTSRSLFFVSTLLTRYFVLVFPLFVLIFGMNFFGFLFFRDQIPWSFLFRFFLLNATLIWVFSNIGMLVSVLLRHQKVLISILLIWIFSICLIDLGIIGTMLKWSLPPRFVVFLALLNPVQITRVALLSGMESELSVLGPVGFFLVNKCSHSFLLFLSLFYPTLLGGGIGLLSHRAFCKGDML